MLWAMDTLNRRRTTAVVKGVQGLSISPSTGSEKKGSARRLRSGELSPTVGLIKIQWWGERAAGILALLERGRGLRLDRVGRVAEDGVEPAGRITAVRVPQPPAFLHIRHIPSKGVLSRRYAPFFLSRFSSRCWFGHEELEFRPALVERVLEM